MTSIDRIVEAKKVSFAISKEIVLGLCPRVVKTDEDDATGLEVYNYEKCTNADTPLLKSCRGLVFHGDKLIVKGSPYTDEFFVSEADKIKTALEGTNLSDWKIFESHEGTLIRVFFFGGKWFISTHRKLNAFKSRWSCRDSFGVLFVRALEHELTRGNQKFKHFLLDQGKDLLEKFTNSLQHNKQYFFLLLNNNENRIVCDVPGNVKPWIYHIQTNLADGTVDNTDIGLATPLNMEFSDLDCLIEYVQPLDHRTTQGVIMFHPDGRQLKIYSSEYGRLYTVRGNVPSLKFRYLQVRTDPELEKTLREMYPSSVSEFDRYEQIIKKIAQRIHTAYVKRYTRGEYAFVPKPEFPIMVRLHNWHLENKQENKVYLNEVLYELDQCEAEHLNHMIKGWLKETENENVE
jgi:hypothetical protein